MNLPDDVVRLLNDSLYYNAHLQRDWYQRVAEVLKRHGILEDGTDSGIGTGRPTKGPTSV
jgi:hypothetical protein